VDHHPVPWPYQLRAIAQFFEPFGIGSGCFGRLVVLESDDISGFGCSHPGHLYVFGCIGVQERIPDVGVG
jgi:hypothetical protein